MLLTFVYWKTQNGRFTVNYFVFKMIFTARQHPITKFTHAMVYLLGLSFLILSGCASKSTIVVLQPFGDFPVALSASVANKVRAVLPQVQLRRNIPFPNGSFYKPRQRYRADSIIRFLRDAIGDDSTLVGLTQKDISATKGSLPDFGIMGLGYRPGDACVVSTFQLRGNKEKQFYKVVLHELGHTEGLPHCAVKTCFMRDAEGGNPIDEETGFCRKCALYLRMRGWLLN